MAAYSLSSKAAADLSQIYEYTILNFGLKKAREYLTGLHARFESLAANPMQGRSAIELSPGLRRLEFESHVVFYVPKAKGKRHSDRARPAPEHGHEEASVAGAGSNAYGQPAVATSERRSDGDRHFLDRFTTKLCSAAILLHF